MRPYEIFEKVCIGGLYPGVTLGAPSMIGRLPSGRKVEIYNARCENFMVDGKIYNRFHAFAGRGCSGYPEDKLDLSKYLKTS